MDFILLLLFLQKGNAHKINRIKRMKKKYKIPLSCILYSAIAYSIYDCNVLHLDRYLPVARKGPSNSAALLLSMHFIFKFWSYLRMKTWFWRIREFLNWSLITQRKHTEEKKKNNNYAKRCKHAQLVFNAFVFVIHCVYMHNILFCRSSHVRVCIERSSADNK